MNILVTGGSGFLGKHLCRALTAEGHSITNLDVRDNPEVKTVRLNILDEEAIAPHFTGVDAVFHLASYIEVGESVEQPRKYLENNIMGTLSVLEAMRKNTARTFIFSSSAAVYGEPMRTPIKEDDRTLPISPYGMTKLAMEGLVSSYAFSHGFMGVALRYFNLYGPGEDHEPESHAIPRFIMQMMNDEDVTVWGDGTNRRDYVYIDDVVRAHILALKLPQGFHYMNLSGKNATPVIEVVRTLERIMGKPAKVANHPPRLGDPQELYADAAKAKEVLGWEPQVDLETGLRRTVEAFGR